MCRIGRRHYGIDDSVTHLEEAIYSHSVDYIQQYHTNNVEQIRYAILHNVLYFRAYFPLFSLLLSHETWHVCPMDTDFKASTLPEWSFVDHVDSRWSDDTELKENEVYMLMTCDIDELMAEFGRMRPQTPWSDEVQYTTVTHMV